jgi:hypothetical protein
LFELVEDSQVSTETNLVEYRSQCQRPQAKYEFPLDRFG